MDERARDAYPREHFFRLTFFLHRAITYFDTQECSTQVLTTCARMLPPGPPMHVEPRHALSARSVTLMAPAHGLKS